MVVQEQSMEPYSKASNNYKNRMNNSIVGEAVVPGLARHKQIELTISDIIHPSKKIKFVLQPRYVTGI